LSADVLLLSFRCVTHLYVLFAIELIRITGVQECDARDGEGCNAA